MDNKSFFAQLGVVVLLSVNVVGYYLFLQNGSSLFYKDSQVAQADHDTKQVAAEEQEKKITIAKESPTFEPNSPELPTIPEPPQALPLPFPLPGADATDAEIRERLASLKNQATLDGVAEQLASIMPSSPWHIEMKIVGTRTELVARVRNERPGKTQVHLKIICDHVAMNPTDSLVQATGKVTVASDLFNGSCEGVTLMLGERRLYLERSVEIMFNSRSGSEGDTFRTRTDHFEIDFGHESLDDATTNEVRPAQFKTPVALMPPALGSPR